jgi:RNA polymerase sigma-70 factor (ECF subfamily)
MAQAGCLPAVLPGRSPMTENSPNPIPPGIRSLGRTPEESRAADAQSLIAQNGISLSEDEQLLERVAKGDQQAMGQIFDRYSRMVYSVAFRVLSDSGHAEDVLQDVFFKVWREPHTFLKGRGSLGAWLAVVARNRAIDALRRRKPTDSVEDVVLVASTNLAAESERNTMIEMVRKVMKALPLEQQASMELAYFEGLSHSEIAERTGDPLGTVKTRIRSALITLRKALER